VEPTVAFDDYKDDEVTYRLSSVGRFGGAHYISYNLENDKWYKYNDLEKNRLEPGYVAVEDLGRTLPLHATLGGETYGDSVVFYRRV
jgi:hypothetical protein